MKKKLMMITTLSLIIVMAVAGTALAGNGQNFATQVEDYETVEEFHTAVLAEKLEIVKSKLADESITQEEADAITAHLTACDGDCDTEGENPLRPVDGWGIFGAGNNDGQGLGTKGQGNGSGNGNRGANRLENCDAV